MYHRLRIHCFCCQIFSVTWFFCFCLLFCTIFISLTAPDNVIHHNRPICNLDVPPVVVSLRDPFSKSVTSRKMAQLSEFFYYLEIVPSFVSTVQHISVLDSLLNLVYRCFYIIIEKTSFACLLNIFYEEKWWMKSDEDSAPSQDISLLPLTSMKREFIIIHWTQKFIRKCELAEFTRKKCD